MSAFKLEFCATDATRLRLLAESTHAMSANSPNNSTLTFSPLLNGKKIRDNFRTPQNPSIHHPTGSASGSASAVKPTLSFSNSFYNHQSSPQPGRNFNSVLESENQTDPFDEDTPLSQADKLRLWRHDALLQHHYTTAAYIGDKVLTLTNDPNDAFWLAQVHYSNDHFQVARNILLGFEDSVGCRYLAGLCLLKLEKLDEALDIVGEFNPFKKQHSVKNTDGGIKVEASLCFLRGKIFAKQNNFDRAKDCYKEAVLVDVKCFEAFNELISNHLLTPDEEWDLLNNLNFDDAENNNELVKMLYITRLNKYQNINIFEEAKQRLSDEYNLADNNDIILSQAELLYMQCRFEDCLDLCKIVIQKDDLNLSAMANYLSCLFETGKKNELFLIAHKLAEAYPNHYITWLAIGIYYFATKQTNEARMFFSKASTINPSFGPAWIGFAHTFAADGEHEQAISAYATAARLFPGVHLPNLFLGMQYLQMSNFTLANEYLNYSHTICSADPLLLNELGVLNYHQGDLSKAESFFQRALKKTKNIAYGSKPWVSIHCNLAHVYRKQRHFDKSITHFNQVLKLAKSDSNTYSTLGLIYLKIGKISKGIEMLHMSLSISPGDTIATDLLEKALEINLKLYNDKFMDIVDSSTP
ncbi:anaphase promoting complex subunit [Martiniozyma asiatica (nom. inval.)]|nr:anaphase promoting complex subunit [Martiniozyma asiatica]